MTSKKGITNFYEHKSVQKKLDKNEIKGYEDHQISLNSRIACVASSGSGKTNWLLGFISLSTGSFSHIYVCYKASEPLYEFLAERVGDENITFFTDLSLMPTVNELAAGNKLVIFDDQVNESAKKQSIITDYTIRCRKFQCTLIILSQSYFGIPKIQRGQLSYLVLLKISSSKDLALILRDFSLGIDRDQLLEMYKIAVSDGFGHFLKINTKTGDRKKKFSKDWSEYYDVRGEFDSDSDDDDKKKK